MLIDLDMIIIHIFIAHLVLKSKQVSASEYNKSIVEQVEFNFPTIICNNTRCKSRP